MKDGAKKKILFVLYNNFYSNSAFHVHGIANELVRAGLECMVAVPSGAEELHKAQVKALYKGVDFSDLDSIVDWKADIVHCWTPRIIVVEFIKLLSERTPFKIVVHLEDSEESILERSFGVPVSSLRLLPDKRLNDLIPRHLSHPNRYRNFISEADGVSMLVETLEEFIPSSIPRITFWPSADSELFKVCPVNLSLRRKYGIKDNTIVIVYNGNVHHSNYLDVRSIYVAVALLNREGIETILVRTGRDSIDFLGTDMSWISNHVVNLGYVERREMPKVLSMANVFVQPGKDDKFNAYRFPCKLPEFLAIGRPVILPKTNIGCEMEHGRDAYILDNVDACGIFETVSEIVKDDELRYELAGGARRFFESRLSWSYVASALFDFYNSL